jgi:mannosyltransferase OCH1-like enzyme
LWTDSTSLEFIASHYPWFLKTYKGYKLPVQRVDSLKYFLMLKFGGIYIDMDNVISSPSSLPTPAIQTLTIFRNHRAAHATSNPSSTIQPG